MGVGAVQAHATFLGYPTEIAWVSPSNNVYIYMPREYTTDSKPFYENLIGEKVDPGTNPAAAGGWSYPEFTWKFAWASGGTVWQSQPSIGPHSENLGIAPNTSPSEGGEFAFQANTNILWVGHEYQGQGMLAGTSPSSVTGNGWVAFQANNTDLIVWNKYTHTGVNTLNGMAPGTSPSITELGNGSYVVAFVANTGRLWTYCSCDGFGRSTTLGIETGTSPSITANGPNYEGWVATFQGAGSHHLWVYNQSGEGKDLGGGISPSTSPAIIEQEGITAEYQIAFHATKNNWLETYSQLTGIVTTEKVMRAGSSPDIAP